MSNENIFLKKAFASGTLFTGFIQDPYDKRDYKFSDLLKSQKKMKTVKKKITQLVQPNRGSYRKPNYGKVLKTVIVKETVPVKSFLANSPLIVDHSLNMSPIKNQANRGTCVAFAGAAMKEFQEKVEHKKEVTEGKRGSKNKEYDYSEQWLYYNCKKIDSYNGEGTYPRAVMKVLNKIGVPTEKAWPYTTDSSIDIGKPKSWSELIARWAIVGSYWSVANLIELKAALIDGPVVIGIPVFFEWSQPVGGRIDLPANPNNVYGGHAVCAVGYNDNTKYVKFKNSWGDLWGHSGYGFLSYDYINQYLWSAWAARDISVTKNMLKGTGEDLTPLVW